MRCRLQTLTKEEYQSANLSIRQKFWQLDIVKKANCFLIYYSINKEVDTVLIIKRLLESGKAVALPVCTQEKSIQPRVIDNLERLVPGIYGLSEPGPTAPLIRTGQLDLIVLPGVAFDEKGVRLGHGAGYYDRFLAGSSVYKLGLAYDFQVKPQIPVEPHDVLIDGLLTPSGFHDFSRNADSNGAL